MIRAGAIAALALACAAPAFAGFPVQSEETCPVGGETFTFTTTGSYSIFGQRPDGKPFGSWTFPLALPECPSNALVVYREFKPEEIPALTALVLSPEYQALRDETPYFRASWLAARMDAADPLTSAFLLLSATWEADFDPVLKARYQRAFADVAVAMPVDSANLDSLFLHYRRANALRELGDFAGADAALDLLPLAALDVSVPQGDDVEYEAVRDARSRRFLFEMIPLMRKVIAAGNTSSDPMEMMDDRVAAGRCADMIEEDPAAPLPARCTEPAVRKQADIYLKNRRGDDDMAATAAEAVADVEDTSEDR